MKIQVIQADGMKTAYIKLNGQGIAHSVEINDAVIVDCDEFDQVIGVELLSLRRIPSAEDIEKHAHIRTEDKTTLAVALQHLMRMSATSGSLTRNSQLEAEPIVGRELETH